MRIHHIDFNAPLLQFVMERPPVIAGGLHGHRRDLVLVQPLDQGVLLSAEHPKDSHRFLALSQPAGRDSHIVLGRADINASGSAVNRGQFVQRLGRSTRSRPFGFSLARKLVEVASLALAGEGTGGMFHSTSYGYSRNTASRVGLRARTDNLQTGSRSGSGPASSPTPSTANRKSHAH